MNKLILAINSCYYNIFRNLLSENPKWLQWSEKSGKNALHFIGGVDVSSDKEKAEALVKMVKLLLTQGMDINSVHKISEKEGFFPATPLWYAYTRGRNEKLYTFLLKNGANPEHCMFAIAWNDDVKAALLFKEHGATIVDAAFLAAFYWRRYTIAEWFLKNGVDVNSIGSEDTSALLLAVKRKEPVEHIELLLQYGADIRKKNRAGLSPLKLVETNRQRKILKLFASKNL